MASIFLDRGRESYRTVWDLQKDLFNRLVDEKRNSGKVENEYLIFVEHDPVYTMGRRAKETNMLMSDEWLQQHGIECIPIERGGDITFHGPGQLVAYPIIDLQAHKIGVRDYVNILEQAVINTIATYGITGERIDGATGVWIGKGTSSERKICAIGVKCSRSVTMHGLALNASTDLNYFRAINPCGFTDKGVTSISEECDKPVDLEEVKSRLRAELYKLLKL